MLWRGWKEIEAHQLEGRTSAMAEVSVFDLFDLKNTVLDESLIGVIRLVRFVALGNE